jgi:purine-nucleoside phosphorylase
MLKHPLCATILSAIRNKTDFSPEIAVILGSGLTDFIGLIETVCEIPYEQIHEIMVPSVRGHPGMLVFGTFEGKRVAVFAGRRHLYEGLPAHEATLAVQVAHSLGAGKIVLTCASGALNERFLQGDTVLITDHINYMGTNPVFELVRDRNSHSGPIDPPFVNLSRVYETRFADGLAKYAEKIGARLNRATLAAVLGPTYETPAERRLLRQGGADIVSMSVVPEAIMARYLGMSVAAASLVTNDAGESDDRLTHQDVLNSAGRYGGRFATLLAKLVELFND